MTSKRPRAFTGVARGGLGTATALDDTQVYDVAELNAPELNAPGPDAPAPVGAHPVRRRASATRIGAGTGSWTETWLRGSSHRPVPGPVWLAGGAVAALLVIGVLGAVLGNATVEGGGAGLEGGPNLPAAIATPSIAPSDEGGGKGNGNGRGGGNGHGDGDGD
jgi:hypothetical protein